MKYDKSDKMIYRAMIELGWIIATTEEEVKWFEEANKDLKVPNFDAEKCLEKLRERLFMENHPKTFTPTQKICALAMRFYQGMKWEPKVGDYYCLTRDGLELFQIRESDGENFYIRKVLHPGQETLLPQDLADAWKISEFQEGFGVNRVWVHPSIFEKVL